MNDFNFTQWIAAVAPMGLLIYFLYSQMVRNNQFWAKVLGELCEDVKSQLENRDKK